MAAVLDIIKEFFVQHPMLVYLLRIVLATFLGAIIGLERTKRSKEAGIRTHCIIAGAAALFMVISKYAFFDMADAVGSRGADPARIAAQVVTGISFLGAGVIYKNGNTVKGLTTAAGIWATAAVGMACGSGLYIVAIFMAVLILGVQLLMHHFNVGYDAYSNGEIRMTLVDTPEIRAILKEKQKELGITIVSSRITTCADNTLNMILQVRMKQNVPFSAVLKFMDEHPEIKSLSI